MTCWRRLRDWNEAGVWQQLLGGGRAEAFVRWVRDPDPLVRRPAVKGLGIFLDDGVRTGEIDESFTESAE